MKGLIRRFGPAWRVQRRRHPRATARLEAGALALRGGLAEEVRALRARVADLQRDHLLLAAHVSTLTERLGEGSTPTSPDDEAARQRARLAAIAFYEERIGRLEQQATGRGHARPHEPSASDSRISGEQSGESR